MFPVAGGIGLLFNRSSDNVAGGSAQVLEGDVPQVSTMVDAAGNPIAWLYSQRRFEVPTDQIADTIGQALQYVPKQRLLPCTNCGLAPMDREVALKKLQALAEGAALARKRYG